MKKTITLLALIVSFSAVSQGVSTKRLIDIPTAFSMKQAEIEMSGRLYAQNGMSGEVNIGVFDDFHIGVSYGGSDIIGRNQANPNGQPGVRLHYRIMSETFHYPNLAIGFDSQGYGPWYDNGKRYDIKSRGLYLVISKNYFVSGGTLGTLGLHIGVNYNVTEKEGVPDNDDIVNIYAGFDKSLIRNVNLLVEYDFAFNDNHYDSDTFKTSNKGYLNLGLRWTFSNDLHLEVNFKDILNNKKEEVNANRELRIIYNTAFFEKK